jgi:hypothetical protein
MACRGTNHCSEIHKGKGKAVPLHAKHARRGGRGIAVPILIPNAGMSWVVSHPSTLRKETWYPLYL